MAKRKKLNEEDQPKENIENSDDTFGLPEIEYEPLKREEPPKAETIEQPVAYTEPVKPVKPKQSYTPMEEETQQNDPSYYNNEEDDSSPWPKILGIAAFLLVVGGAAWYFGYYSPRAKQAEIARQEQIARDEAARKEAGIAEQLRLDRESRAADSLANLATPVAGEVSTLSERTGRYYVIAASGIDGDLIMDYAKKLSAKGVTPKIIPPHGKVKFYRLAIAEGDTYTTTQATADQLKAEYTAGTWVVKY